MKILFVIRDMFTGGAGKQLALTAQALVDRGHSVFLYTYIGDTMEHVIDPRIIYIPEPHAPHNKILEYIYTPVHVHHQLKMVKPDIAISWRANAGCMLVLGAIGTNIKTIFSERTDPYMETNLMLKVATRICDFSDGGVFQTSMARDYYKKLSAKSVVIPNPISPNIVFPEIVPIINRKKEIAWVGRFMNCQKRIDIALKAMKIIHKYKPEYTLALYGDGVDMGYAKKMVNNLGLNKCVEFHGVTNDVINVIKCSRLLMLSSDYEGIPNVIIEAFTSGTPVVSTDCSPGGARVLIDDGENGYIVPIRDYKMLACKVLQVIDDDAISTDFILKSREKLKEFDPQSLFDNWNTYIKKISRE